MPSVVPEGYVPMHVEDLKSFFRSVFELGNLVIRELQSIVLRYNDFGRLHLALQDSHADFLEYDVAG